jgi:hypothetical protein
VADPRLARVYLHSTAAGYLYEAQLRHELTTRLGVEWGPIKNGIADIVGIDKPVRDHFSDRRKEILEHLDEVGFRTARAADIATVATRQAKTPGTEASMRDLWDVKAAEIDWDPSSVADCLGRQHETHQADLDGIGAELLGSDGLTERASTFDRRDLLRGICERLPDGATVSQIEDMADAILERREAVRLLTRDEGLIGSNVIRRKNGKIIAAAVSDARWSTVELMAIERDIVDRAVARARQGCCVVPFNEVAAVLARRPTLAAEQASMVRTLCRSGNGIDVVSAAAGTGKTFTLDAMREAWEASGHRVLGAALAGIAAEELRSTAGIPSSTLAMLRINLDAGHIRLDDRTVLMIDEVGMAGTPTLAPILAAAHDAGAKVVLVGDPHQLPEIDAGGVLRGLTHRLEPVELVENRRQRDDWERHALAELRHGIVDNAFSTYQASGRVIEAPTAIDVRRRMVADWWAHEVAGDRAAIFAYRRAQTDDLNARARVYRVQTGKVHGPEIVVDDRPYQAGDHIICLRNNRRLGVKNGTRGTVTHVDPDRRTITIDTGRRNVVTLPADYVDAGHIAHGYATTIHKTQGATVDHGLLLGTDELSRERGYVGMSRGRLTNHLYIVGATPADDTTGHGPPASLPDPVDVVRSALHRTSQQQLAIDSGDALATWPVEELVAEHHRLAHMLATCPGNLTTDIEALDRRRELIETDLEPLVERHNQLADRRLNGPNARNELRVLRDRIGERAAALDRIDTELADARSSVKERQSFLTEHAGDYHRLDAVRHQLDREIDHRVEAIAAEPGDYERRVLGRVPHDPAKLDIWKRGARILEEHHIGLDQDPAVHDRLSLLGSPRERAETRARLEVVAITPEPDSVIRTLERDSGIGLGW